MDFQKMLNDQKAIIDEYSFGNKPIRAILNGLQKKSEELKTPIEKMEIVFIREVCNKQKTRRGFSTTKTIISGFYSHLGLKDIAEQINLFEYQNRINYFVSFDHLRESFNNEIKRLLSEQILVDENRLGDLKMCVYLTALGLSVEEISLLKKADYNNNTSTIVVGERIIQLSEPLNREVDYFIKTDGYTLKRLDSTCFYPFVESDSFLKQKRINSPVNKAFVYKVFERDMSYLNFDMTDVQKSIDMWNLLQKNDLDVNNPNFLNLLKYIDLDKITNNVKYKTDIVKTEMESFIQTVKSYYGK